MRIRTRWNRRLAGAVACLAAFSGLAAQASAQVGLGTSNGLPPGYQTNPFNNPYMNPFLNPYARNGTMGGQELLLSALAARQQAQVAAAQQPAAAPAKPAEMPYQAMVPGGTVARTYFNRTNPVRSGNPQQFNRYSQYFRRNGR